MKEVLGDLEVRWKRLKPEAFAIGLVTKSPLEHDKLMGGLNAIGKQFSYLTESKYDKDDERFVLKNSESEIENQIVFQLNEATTIQFAWGVNVNLDFEPEVRKLFDCIEEDFGLYPINVSLIDFRLFATTIELDRNLYQVIWDTFLRDTRLGSLFNSETILPDDLRIRGRVGENCKGLVKIESNIIDSEIIKGNFKDDRIDIKVGVAQTRGFSFDERLEKAFRRHFKTAIEFIRNKFLPNIADPLDRALVEVITPKLENL